MSDKTLRSLPRIECAQVLVPYHLDSINLPDRSQLPGDILIAGISSWFNDFWLPFIRLDRSGHLKDGRALECPLSTACLVGWWLVGREVGEH